MTGSNSYEKRKKYVFQLVQENENIGVNELTKLVEKHPILGMQKNTMLKILNDLESEHKIRKIMHEGVQKFNITTMVSHADLGQSLIEDMEKSISTYEKILDDFKQNTKNLSYTKKSVVLSDVFVIASCMEWDYLTSIKIHKITMRKSHLNRINSIKERIFQIASDNSPKSDSLRIWMWIEIRMQSIERRFVKRLSTSDKSVTNIISFKMGD